MSDPIANPFYYLDNFQMVLDWVAARYPDLLEPRENQFITTFASLPRPARALLVRMVMRKGDWFRASKLDYAEIGPASAAAHPLIDAGWLAPDPALTLEQVFALYTKPELQQLFALPRALFHASKGAQQAHVAALHANIIPDNAPKTRTQNGACASTPPAKPEHTAAATAHHTVTLAAQTMRDWSAAFDATIHSVYQLTISALVERLRLMFFGNLHQDWTEFVLADLGIYSYEKVSISDAARGFQVRADIDHYLAISAARDAWQQGADAETVLTELARVAPSNQIWLEQRRAKLHFAIGQQYEREQNWPAAIALYQDNPAPEARIRLLRVYIKCEQFHAACLLAHQIAQAPQTEAELQQWQRILPRLHSKLKQQPDLTPPQLPTNTPAPAPSQLKLVLPAPAVPTPVELLAAAHLAEADGVVLYVENTLINSLLGLLCWDAIFAPLPGAFFHPYQRGPVDLHSPDFITRRQPHFDQALQQLDSDAWQHTIRDNFQRKAGLQSPFVHWGILDPGLLDLALACLPARHLHAVFTRILHDIANNRSGLPDLIQFWPAQQRYRLIEVKGPGDKLQDNQIRWLDYFARHQIPVAVCWVRYQEPT